MTKSEAIQQMKQGIKITHYNFTKDEWMTQRGCRIFLEDGVRCYQEEFWHYRTGKSWEDGYSVYKG